MHLKAVRQTVPRRTRRSAEPSGAHIQLHEVAIAAPGLDRILTERRVVEDLPVPVPDVGPVRRIRTYTQSTRARFSGCFRVTDTIRAGTLSGVHIVAVLMATD